MVAECILGFGEADVLHGADDEDITDDGHDGGGGGGGESEWADFGRGAGVEADGGLLCEGAIGVGGDDDGGYVGDYPSAQFD